MIVGWLLVIVLIVAAAATFALLFRRLSRFTRSRNFRIDDRRAWQQRWQELEAMLGAGDSHWQVAVMEADKLFGRVMQSMALPGKDFGERLKYLTASRPALRAVWPAHLTRNRLVHESNYVLSRQEATRAIRTFERGLKELGVL